MSPEAQIEALHRALKTEKLFLLMKRGYYYRPNAAGYTDQIREAGRYTAEEANIHTSNGRSQEVHSQVAPLEKFDTFEALMVAERKLISDEREFVWAQELLKAADPEYASKTGRVVAALSVAQMPLDKRREALLCTLGLWQE